MAYFDSSALVKLVIEEDGSDEAAALWDGADAVLSSRVAYAEVRAALATARRARLLTSQQLTYGKQLWTGLWNGLRIVELSGEVATLSGDLAEHHALSGFDAIHLASAVLLSPEQLVVATWDARLHAAVDAAGLAALPDRV